jgi:hypothetical protein
VRTKLPLPWLWIALAAAGACAQRTEVQVDTPAVGLHFSLVQVMRPGYNASYDNVVICRSRLSGSAAWEDDVPRGAALVARLDGGAVSWLDERGDPLQAARKGLRPGRNWMAFQHPRALRVTADHCRNWLEFVPARHLDPRQVERSSGLACQDGPCVDSRLHNQRWEYRDLEVVPGAEPARTRMKFVMHSMALMHRAGLELATDDGGKTWRATPRAGPDPAPTFVPSPGRYLDAKP